MRIVYVMCAVFAMGLMGCTDAFVAKVRVTCYSGGKLIFDSCSTGKVASEANSDGYYFNENTSGKLIEVSGNCVISMKAPCPATVIGVPTDDGPLSSVD